MPLPCYLPKLIPGTVITVHGWVMLGDLDEGHYRIKKIAAPHGITIYCFTKPRGNKVIARHYATIVDTWLRNDTNSDLNKIVVKSRPTSSHTTA